MALSWSFFLLILVSIGGCGYTMLGATPQATATRRVVAVVPFTNQTHEPELESHLTAALRQALTRHQALRLSTAAAASQRLYGVVQQFRIHPVAFDVNDNALQYRLEADILVRLVDETAGQTLFEQNISTWAEYLTSARRDVREEVVARDAAILLLAQRFAERCAALLTVMLL